VYRYIKRIEAINKVRANKLEHGHQKKGDLEGDQKSDRCMYTKDLAI